MERQDKLAKLQILQGTHYKFGDPLNSSRFYESSGRIIQSKLRIEVALADVVQTIKKLKRNIKLINRRKSSNENEIEKLKAELENKRYAKVNLQLAQDRNFESPGQKGFVWLKGASGVFRKLKAYFPELDNAESSLQGSIHPQKIHTLANRGCYTFMNGVYRESERNFGKTEMENQDKKFEGMAIYIDPKMNHVKELFRKTKEELPFLEKAIQLTERMEGTRADQLFAKAQYKTLLGEIYHGLAHFEEEDNKKRIAHSEKSATAFIDAIRTFQDILSRERTPAYEVAFRYLTEQKAPHLLEQRHLDENQGLGKRLKALLTEIDEEKKREEYNELVGGSSFL